MIVIAHEHPSVHPRARHGACLAQRAQEETPVILIPEDGLAPVAAGHDVVKSPRKLNADAARHGVRKGIQRGNPSRLFA